MNDLISRSHFDSRVRQAGGMAEYELTEDFKDGVLTVLELLKTEPSVQPVKCGTWKRGNLILNRSICSICGWRTDELDTFDFNYCPNCGAKMESEDKR